MSAKTIQSDDQKLKSLRDLMKTVQENTKNEFQSKDSNLTKEQKAASKVLQVMLGREPSADELRSALSY